MTYHNIFLLLLLLIAKDAYSCDKIKKSSSSSSEDIEEVCTDNSPKINLDENTTIQITGTVTVEQLKMIKQLIIKENEQDTLKMFQEAFKEECFEMGKIAGKEALTIAPLVRYLACKVKREPYSQYERNQAFLDIHYNYDKNEEITSGLINNLYSKMLASPIKILLGSVLWGGIGLAASYGIAQWLPDEVRPHVMLAGATVGFQYGFKQFKYVEVRPLIKKSLQKE